MVARLRAPTPVWIDCDPGHDDACTIIMAAYHPSIELLGISTVFGNTSLEQTTANTLSILKLIGKSSVPVFSGASKPMARPRIGGESFHGTTGIDGTTLLPTVSRKVKGKAIEEMYKSLMTTPAGTAWIVAIGPLTNIAMLFKQYPQVQEHIKGLSIMGGVIGNDFCGGSATATAPQECWNPDIEFNILCDPEAASCVLSESPRVAGKTTLVPLDLTHRLCFTEEILDRLQSGVQGTTTFRLALYEFLRFYYDAFLRISGLRIGAPLHDPVALAVVLSDMPQTERLDFDVGLNERWQVHVSLEESNAGQLSITPSQEGIVIPKDLDVDKFWLVFTESVHRADEATCFQIAAGCP